MKVTLVISALSALAVVMAHPQRSPYAPRPVNYPAVLPRFGEENTDTNLENRLSEGGSNSSATSNNNNNNNGNDLQDPYLVSQAQSWPDDRKPFWLINAQHIATHLGQPSSSQSINQTPPRSPFAANSSP